MDPDKYNRLLEDIASRNRSTVAIDRATDAMNLLRQRLEERDATDETLKREWIYELRQIGERLALVDRGVQQVDRGVGEVKQHTGHTGAHPKVEEGPAFAFNGWRVPIGGLLKVGKFILPFITAGVGYLARHLLH